MSPHSHHHRVIHAPRALARHSAAVFAAVLVIVGAPFVVQALDAEPVASTLQVTAPATVALSGDDAEHAPELVDRAERLTPPDDDGSARVASLQETSGVTADGRYASVTQQAQRIGLDTSGPATAALPVPVLPPGPDASAWAALRDCESGGDYSITNPSGKYRGAYQFDRTTWDSVAGRHDPALVGVDPAAAAPADQDAMASALYTERGAQPWPHCGRHLR